MGRKKNCITFILFFSLFISWAAAQRFMEFDPPMAGPKKTLRYTIGDEITVKLKDDAEEFYTGYITSIEEKVFYVNRIPVPVTDVEAIRIRRHKGRAIIPRAIGWGAQVYVAARIINSLINHTDPVITPIEIGITAPLIVGYYVYEFAINTRKRTYKVNPAHPLKIIILTQ